MPGHGGGSAAASQVASQAVMSGIAEALVATAVGIAVALPAVAAYNYFQRRVSTLLSSTEVLSNLVLAYLSDSSRGLERSGGSSSGANLPHSPKPALSSAQPLAGAN